MRVPPPSYEAIDPGALVRPTPARAAAGGGWGMATWGAVAGGAVLLTSAAWLLLRSAWFSGSVTTAELLGGVLFGLVAGAGSMRLAARPARAEAAADRSGPKAADLALALDQAAVFARGLDGTIRHWSRGCERLFGITAANALGRNAPELLGTRFPAGGMRAAQAELLREGQWQGEVRHRRAGGAQLVAATHWILQRCPRGGEPEAVVELHADATALAEAESALRAGEARLLLAQDLAGVGTWEWEAEADRFTWTPAQYGIDDPAAQEGLPRPLESFLAYVHDEDRDRVRQAARRALEIGEYEAEFRLLRPGRDGAHAPRWLIGRGRRLPGQAGRRGPILGVHVDITARKEAEQRQILLMREVDHRAKNALAVVQAVLRLTRAATAEEFGRAIGGRVSALARAQTLLTESRWVGADLRALVEGELQPFLGSAGSTRIFIAGPAVTILPMAAQPLSMTLHELATNAAKYGSLSAPGGALTVRWTLDAASQRLDLTWEETGGPPIAAPPASSGFGSRMIRMTITEQLSGRVHVDWAATGLRCHLDLPCARVVVGYSPMTGDESWRPS